MSLAFFWGKGAIGGGVREGFEDVFFYGCQVVVVIWSKVVPKGGIPSEVC